MKTTLIFILLLAGCSTKVQNGVVNPEFAKAFSRFETYSRERGRDTVNDNALSIQFGSLPSPIAGECIMGMNQIIIDRNTWYKMDWVMQEQLIIHEISHCLLNRIHNSANIVFDGDKNVSPISIMNPYLFDSAIYEKHQKYYLDELFGVKGYEERLMP
jgi:hypothetical protein